MPANESVHDSLIWAQQSRERWQSAYNEAVGTQRRNLDADLARRQIVMLDRMIARYERFLAG
jgi:hypothetical protein